LVLNKSIEISIENREKIKRNQEKKQEKNKTKHIKGPSFGSVDRNFSNRMKMQNLGPGYYNCNFPNSSKLPQRFKTSLRNLSLPTIGPGPGQYNLSKDLLIIDEGMRKYKQLHDSTFNGNCSSLERNNNPKTFSPSIYELIKKTVSLKQQALLKIRSSIVKSEKNKLRASLRKKNLGFTSSVRKNEYNILQRLIVSPGPIYDTRKKFAENAIKILIPLDKRKSLWDVSPDIPGPGSYNVGRNISKYEGDAYKELNKYVKRHRILKTILKNSNNN